ncbi:MAG TPA: hypothetical protein VF131_16910 [Blastocatellia bacterium]|nr:hypothetical protein [Blastocatellia bacterium]
MMISSLETMRARDFFHSQGGLNYLAQQTGGLFIRNSNDISRGISRVLDDQRGYYLIGYVPEESTFKSVQGRREFHKILVKVKRPGLHVRSRAGFFGVADDERQRSDDAAPGRQLIAALTSPFASGDMRLKLTSFYGQDADRGAFVRSLLHIDARDLTFTEEPDGTRKAVIDLAAITFGENGRPVDQNNYTYTIGVRAEDFEKLRESGFVYNAVLPVKKVGAYQLRVAMRDARSGRVGSANQFIEVPDFNKGRLTLSGIVVAGHKMADPKKSDASGSSLSQPATGGQGETGSEQDPQAGPAVRTFRAGMLMDYGFFIYNAKLDRETRRPQIETQLTLYRDGKPVFTGQANPFDPSQQSDLKRMAARGRLKLGAELPPGEYVLQMVVTDKMVKGKHRTATQWIDFELVN